MSPIDFHQPLIPGVSIRPWDLNMADEMVRAVRHNASHISQWLSWSDSDYGRDQAEAFIRRIARRRPAIGSMPRARDAES